MTQTLSIIRTKHVLHLQNNKQFKWQVLYRVELYITVFETYGFYNKSYFQGCYKRKNDRNVINYKNSKKRRFNSMTCRYEKRKTKKTYNTRKEL